MKVLSEEYWSSLIRIDNIFNNTGSVKYLPRNMRIILTAAFLFAFSLAKSQTMNLQPAFGNEGIVLTDLANHTTDEVAYNILTQSDSKIIAIGRTSDSAVSYFKTVLVRYESNGDIDSSFGNDGMVQIEEADFVYHSAVLQSNGSILIMGDKTGEAPDYISNISVRRLDNDGTPDSSFGTNGIVLLPVASASGYGKGIALLTDGRIIIAGKDAENSSTVVAYALNPNGSADMGFGTDGKRSIILGFAENGLGAIAVQSDNKILLAGYFVEDNNQSGFFCMRLQVNAGTDNSFGNNGVYQTANTSTDFLELNSLLVTENDKLLLTGYISNPSQLSSSLRIIRLMPNGIPDNSFNGNGMNDYYKTLNYDSTFVIPNAVAIHPDNSIYVVGSSVNNSGSFSPFIIRITKEGILDSTLSTEGSGWYYNNQGGLGALLYDISITSADSSIFVAGSKEAPGGDDDILIAAYQRLPDTPGIVYVFNGDGLWTDTTNWLNALVPPTDLPNGATIVIDPALNGTAILNVEQNIEAGGKIIVKQNAKLQVEGNFKIGN